VTSVGSSTRRPMGALEAEVLEVLWREDRLLTPSEVQELSGTELAYTTIMTILVRLWKKGLAERTKVGRAYAYRPTVSEPDLGAERMRSILEGTADRALTMSRFVDRLSARERKALRAALEELET